MPPHVGHDAQLKQTAILVEYGTNQARLLAALSRPAVFGPGCTRVERLETHISCVFLTGRYAYKIKKAVAFGFLDFTTLEARHTFCKEELRLNRRLAPALYLDVVPITGSIDAPVLGGDGPALEYAVKMREFPQDALASRILARSELSAADIDALAAKVAAFHGAIGVAAPASAFGAPSEVLRVARQNFVQLRPLLATVEEHDEIDALAAWTEREHAARRGAFLRRRKEGFVRECHGDLHLNNVARIDGELTIFDCIEFNESMRWIDVMSEVAFTVMDLEDRRRADLAHRFLNAYLERTGDYAGLAVLRFYLVYRSLVRAKIARLRAAQLEAGAARSALHAEYRGYVNLARRYALPPRPALVVTHGLAGCGKTTLSQPLLEAIAAVRIRSDVERKRMHGVGALKRGPPGIDHGLYAAAATEATYRRLTALARHVVGAGLVAIIDATFLRRWQRDLFHDLATALGVALVIIDFAARDATLRERVAQRAAAGSDASDANLAVLEHQLHTREPLAPEEQAFVIAYDAEAPLERARQSDAWRAVRERIEAARPFAPADPAVVDPGLGAKVAFLSRPESYAEPTKRVEVLETHMSWVFLTDTTAWKLKKPVRSRYLDFSTEAARRVDCEEELRLNRRLSEDVYLGSVPLALDADGGLRIGGADNVVDWLVKMRRLPGERMLDRLLRERKLQREGFARVIERLARFYRDAAPVTMLPAQYRARFVAEIAENRRELGAPVYGLPLESIEATCAQQLALLERQPGLFDERVFTGRIVEAHGDLRPEHICLEESPQVIDCLEFSRELRLLDPADELGFLTLECERLGAPELATTILGTYTAVTGDAPPAVLVHFYQSYRACVRAKIAIRHLADAAPREPAKWPAQARAYLALAREHLQRCAAAELARAQPPCRSTIEPPL
jgi:aminoglycoside phosphotransferase family enzyme/predicted kinase